MGRHQTKLPTKVVRIRIDIFKQLKHMSANKGKPMAVLVEEMLLPTLKDRGYEVIKVDIKPFHLD